jgi:hypothetical protein
VRDLLKSLMVLYNFVQVLVCGAMCVDVLLVVLDAKYYPASPLSPFCTATAGAASTTRAWRASTGSST